MSKAKYYYDQETLSYKKVTSTTRKIFSRIALITLGCFVAGFVIFAVYISLPQAQTPKEKNLMRELSNMKLQYSRLSKKMTQAQEVLANVEERDNSLYRTYFNAPPLSSEQRKAGFGGINRYGSLEGYDNSQLIIEANKDIDQLQKQIVVESKSLEEISKLAKKHEGLLAATPAIQPLAKKDIRRISSGYGRRFHPILKIYKMHNGIDFASYVGSKIHATASGKVIRAGYVSGYGYMVEIDHGYGFETRYAHMSKLKVKRGQQVSRGQTIGLVGNTGLSTGPHVHYEVRKDGRTVNPNHYFHGDLTPAEYADLIRQSEDPTRQSMD